ncbi:MAG: SigB/SigF/SigG family RNA polymerase sigma factor [Clostridiales bacterium]|nr:SigB/SigF/SigG family RNA polymerase sigma factor [Clostridiales bacterium]
MLEHDETLALIEKAKQGDDDAKAKLIEHNMPLIKSIAKRFHGRLEYDDLIQLGSLGFIKAINNFDTSFNVRFSTYAVPMITGEIKRFLRDDGTIKVSRALKSLNIKINRFVNSFKNEHEREPSIEEIAEALGEDPHDIVFAMDSAKCIMSLYGETEDGDMQLMDKLADDSQTSDEMLDKLQLKDIIEQLPEREKKIIMLRYFRDKTQSEVAEQMGISQVQVSRLECKILKSIKDKIGDKTP